MIHTRKRLLTDLKGAGGWPRSGVGHLPWLGLKARKTVLVSDDETVKTIYLFLVFVFLIAQ